MANRVTVKANFETDDFPTQAQFAEWIDSVYFFDDDTTDNLAQGSTQFLVDGGAQTFNGIKTFGSFPITPSTAPTADFQVANKKYVDDNTGGGGTPGGSDTEIQFNDGGAFGADSNLAWDNTNKRLLVGGATSVAQISLAGRGSLATGLSLDDGNSGLFEDSPDDIVIQVAGNSSLYRFESGGQFQSAIGARPAIQFGSNNTRTVPGLIPHKTDMDTGVGTGGSDEISIITGSVEAVRYMEVSAGVIQVTEMDAGLTASTTQTQGNGELFSSFNEVAIVANTNDTVTFPTAERGKYCEVINNGANTLQIFPAAGDDLGAGVDTAITLAAGSFIRFRAYDAINWKDIT